ncbi:MAG: hypothetical protein ABI723_07280 [Bacteroidia bacterium]
MFKLLITDKRYQWFNALLIAVSAALLCKETFIVSRLSYLQWGVYLVVFTTTFFAYLNLSFENNFANAFFNLLRKIRQNPINSFVISAAGFALLILFFVHTFQSVLICVSAALLSLIYFEAGLFSKYISIRKIYFAKTFLLAFIWSLVTVSLPVSFAGGNNLSLLAFFVFARRFLFIAALSIPFDIRDSEKDKVLGYRNFVNLIGIKKSKMLSLLLLGLFIITGMLQYKISLVDASIIVAMCASGIISAILIILYNGENKGSPVILFLTDAMLMVQFFLIIAAKALF